MMGISSSSENEEDENDSYSSSWDDSSECSSSTTDEDKEQEQQNNFDPVDAVASRSNDAKLEMDNITDLRVLFNDTALKKLASLNTKEEVMLNVIQQQRSKILSWLGDLNMPMSEAVITQEMFCDYLMSKGINRDDAVEAFSRFDTEGTGKADGELVHDGVDHPYEEMENGELLYKTKVLQSCNSLPGFIDVFSRTDTSSKHAIKLLYYLVRNRVSANMFSLPLLSGFEDTIALRSSVSKQIFAKLQTELSEPEEHKLLGADGSSTDVRYVGKPYSSIEVSSNMSDVNKLTNGNTGSYWQSDGAARSHWIRLNMKKNTLVKQLFVYVVSADQSYMPQEIVVAVGKKNLLREIKKINIPSFANGPVLLIENLKTFYPVVQINIKRCHSDGCDARIHQLRVSGLKVYKDSEMTISDASIKWFLQLISATAMNNMQAAPVFRNLLINQAKDAFRYIPPMSLCSGSSAKPKFLTEPVLNEVKTFLDTLTGGDAGAEDNDDSLLCQLMYGLAACNLSSVLTVTCQLLDQGDKDINPGHLVSSMHSVKSKYWAKGEKLLKLNYVDCDGGDHKSDTSGYLPPRELINYDSSNYTSDAYKTKSGRTKFTLILEADESVQITRVKVRAENGSRGAKCGMVFLFPLSEVISTKKHPSPEKADNSSPIKTKSSMSAEDIKALYKRLEKFDSWTQSDYDNYKQENIDQTSPDFILTYFSIPEEPNDWDELDLTLNEQMVGKILVVKFLRPRSESCDRIGVVGLNVSGYPRTQDQLMESENSLSESEIKRSEFCSAILSFLIAIIKSLETKKIQGAKIPYVDFTALSTQLISDLFAKAQSYGDVTITRQVLHLCHSVFLNWTPDAEENDTSILFDTFSSIINTPTQYDQSVVAIARSVIVDGAKAFFPNDHTRKEQLLRMLKDINRADELPSTSLVFESLCQFFSDVEPSALLNLPKPKEFIKSGQTPESIDESCFEVMDTLLIVTLHKSLHTTSTLSTGASASPEKTSRSSSSSLSALTSGVTYSVLVKLLSCLQTGLLSWVNAVTAADNQSLIDKSMSLLVAYISKTMDHFVRFCESLLQKSDEELLTMFSNQDDFVFTIIHQLVVFLSDYCKASSNMETSMEILRILWPFMERVRILRTRLPSLFPPLDSDKWISTQTTVMEVLNTWSEESPHNYHNNTHTSKVYNCPGAKVFIIEFDPRCHTERKYDYLEFVNHQGISHKYDQKVGTDSWPLKVEIKGSKLEFTFHSDPSNNEWGYKFTVTAKGVPEKPISMIFDLHLSMALLLGEVCGHTIAMQPSVRTEAACSADVDEDNEIVMLKSNLWKTLFRAGYQPSDKLLQRSLSGRYGHSAFDEVKGFLLELLNDSESDPFKSLLQLLRSKCRSNHHLGTDEISSAILHTFTAFVYHTSELCESMNDYIKNGHAESFLVEGIFQAYTLAEQLRLPLMQQRQKVMERGDTPQFTLAKEMIDKANLLLKFAALTKTPTVSRCTKMSKPRKAGTRRVANNDLLKRLESSIPEKYGQFHLILEFIVEPSWNCLMVEKAIQERTKKAKSLCMAYQFICDYLKLSDSGNILQIDNVLMLRAVLKSQKQFPSHYADAVDGCGLEQESRLRQRFYSLIRQLVKANKSPPVTTASPKNKSIEAASSIIQACLLHLLDVEWRENDLQFLKEINLPQLFFDASKNNVAIRERIDVPTEDKVEMEIYDRDKKYFGECQKRFTEWYNKHSQPRTKSKDVQMFIARHCDLLDVEIYCDGCQQSMPGRRYRCLDCVDMDLCVTCFTGGLTPGGPEHKDDHSFVYFMYKCDLCQAFISGERVHCKVCDDFDLCYGCYKTGKTQPGHEADHDVIKFPQVRLKSACESNALSSYIHQHSWVQFSQLTLSMAGAVFEQGEGRSLEADSDDYTDTAASLLTQCLTLVTECLQKVSILNNKGGTVVEYREEVFVQHSQERIMGLLGSIITLDEQYDAELNMMLTTIDFLKFIFYFASGHAAGVQHSTVQHLALGLLAQLMQKSTISTQVTDEAVIKTQKKSLSELEGKESGLATIEFILQAASACLDKQQGVDWSYSLIRLLQQLVNTPHWSGIMRKYLTDTISNTHHKENDLNLVLCLFILTGFPQIKSPGVSVRYLDYGSDEKEAVILKHFPDRLQSMLIDTTTRKRKMVKDQLILSSKCESNFYDTHIVSLITNLFVENANKLMKGALFDIETHWVLSLCLKAFEQFVSQQVPYDNLEVIRSLVNLAGMGTRLSKNWIVPDLEILSLMMYIKLENNPSNMSVTSSTDPQSPLSSNKSLTSLESAASATPAAAGASPSSPEKGEDPFPDMDEDSRKHFLVLLEMLNVPPSHLRLVYDNHRESPSGLLQALHQLFLEDSPDKLSKQKTKPCPTAGNDKHDNITERMIDFGILPTSALPSADLESLDELDAEPEPDLKPVKKVQPSRTNTANTDQKRTDSTKLLRCELSRITQKAPSHMHLNKINLGLSILHARKALGTILANWSTSAPRINAQLLNCENNNLALVLDVLNRDSSNLKQFEKVVSKVMSCCKEDYLQSIADSASSFMDFNDNKKCKEAVRESPHTPGKKIKGKIQVKGAAVLLLSFDKNCHTIGDSSLQISTSNDMKKNFHSFSGSKWRDIELPGDTIFYNYAPKGTGAGKWKFTVTAAGSSTADSFFTGFVILNHILSTPAYCKIIDTATLWHRLIVITCKQTGAQRLKTVQLLLHLLKSHIDSDISGTDEGLVDLHIDLTYLSPLWKLYKGMSDDQGPEQTPSLLRALTELFYVAENVALQWNKTGQFMSCMIDPSLLKSSVLIGLKNVMAVAAAIEHNTRFSENPTVC